nr:ceramidase domain-containing protein [Herbihabitans rhizosphaerae]
MDTYVDSYCERLEPGLWGEPLNALSNLAFAVAAVAVWISLRTTDGRRVPASIAALPVLIALVFLGSTAFHTTATRWGGLLDVLFIAVFLLHYVAVFTHWFAGLRWRLALVGVGVFVLFTGLVSVTLGRVIPGGSGMYAAALVAVLAFAGWLRFAGPVDARPHWRMFAAAGVVFAVSLTLRTLDRPLCDSMPIGTHYWWHTLNAIALYLVSRAAVARWRQVSGFLEVDGLDEAVARPADREDDAVDQ